MYSVDLPWQSGILCLISSNKICYQQIVIGNTSVLINQQEKNGRKGGCVTLLLGVGKETWLERV